MSDDNRAVRRILPIVILLVTFGALARTAAGGLDNPDTYFHLRIGHEFVHGGWVPWQPGHLTTLESHDWIPTQWLSQVVMAWVEDAFGLPGIAWLSGFLFICWALALYLSARQRADLLAASVVVPVALLIGATSLSMRPQLVSYVMTAATMVLWERARRVERPPWAVIPLTWLWAMLHGMWPVGVVIGIAAAAGIVADRRMSPRGALRFFAVPLLGALAAAVTPAGPRLFPAVLLVNSRSDIFSEWAPPQFTSPSCLILLAVMGLTALLMLRRGRNSWFDVAMLLTAAGWSVYTFRTVPVAATMMAPLAAAALQAVVGERRSSSRSELRWVIGGAIAALVLLAAVVPSTVTPLKQPAWVDPTLRALPAGTVVFDEMTFGSYFVWRYPNLDVALHGYADVYTDKELDDRIAIGRVEPQWQDRLRATGATVALLAPDSPLAYALRTSSGWRVSHVSEDIEMLTAPADWLTSDEP